MVKKRKLKAWVVYSLTGLMFLGIVGITAFITNSIISGIDIDNYSYVLRDVLSTDYPVVAVKNTKIEKPYTNDDVKISINFYETTADKEIQEKSLILYDRTYIPNTGVLYGAEKEFDVVSIYDGVVSNITDDDVFGKIVEIKHNNNLISKYSSLSTVNVSVGDTVASKDIIGKSGKNKVISETQNMLLFELIYNGTNVNPESYYTKDINEMS